jgi:putative nucleotidyltransferase with HDIG domain
LGGLKEKSSFVILTQLKKKPIIHQYPSAGRIMSKTVSVPERTLPLPEAIVQGLKNTPQNPRYHAEGSVYNHTQLVLDAYYQMAPQLNLSPEEHQIFYWGAVLHDLGKLLVTRWEGNRWRSPEHERAGVPIARDILLQQEDLSQAQRHAILDLVRWHHVPLRWGLRQVPLDQYILLATRTDLRRLGIFTIFDIMGRECVRKQEVLDLVYDFYERIVPKVEGALGSFRQIQDIFKASDHRKKNALWTAFQHGEALLLEKILHIDIDQDESPRMECVVTIGPPKAGKSAYVSDNYADHHRFDVHHFQALADRESRKGIEGQGLRYALNAQLLKQQNVVLDGTNLNTEARLRLAELVRGHAGKIRYLFFEKSLEDIRKQNRRSSLPLEDNQLTEAHRQLERPHPWEAHVLHMV